MAVIEAMKTESLQAIAKQLFAILSIDTRRLYRGFVVENDNKHYK